MITLLAIVNAITCVIFMIPILYLTRLVRANRLEGRERLEEKGAVEKREFALKLEVEELHFLIGYPPRFALVPPDEHPYRVMPELVPKLAPLDTRKEEEVIKQWQKWHRYVGKWDMEVRKVADRCDGWTNRRIKGDEALQHAFAARKAEAVREFERYDKMAMEMEIPIDLLQAEWKDEEPDYEAN